MKKIKTWRDPYDAGFSTCRPKEIEIQSGLTVLVGCNGAGKTTLLENIKEILYTEKIPYVYYNNLHDGGSNSAGNFFYNNQIELAASLWTASEGESININLNVLSSKLQKFLQEGIYIKDERYHNLVKALSGEDCEEKITSKERWILLDAIDSGFSVDNVIDLKEFFVALLLESEKLGVDLYIVVSANEYELARNVDCMDVTNGKYLRFMDYEDYRNFIIQSRVKKNKRMIKLTERQNDTSE